MSCKILLFIFLCGLLESCAMTSHAPTQLSAKPTFDYTSHELFGSRPDIISPNLLHDLSPGQYQDFDAYFLAPANSKVAPIHRLYNYLEDSTEQFSFLGETLTASEALQQQQGNCMSLAMVTTALAKRAGINIEYQLMDDAPVFEQGENVIIKGVHVRTKLLEQAEPQENNVLTFYKAGLIVDYFPNETSRFIGNLNESQYVSRYYLNIAADAIESGDYNRAYWFALEAIKLNDRNDSAFNTLAVIYRRAGALEKAEEIYRFGIDSLPTPLTIMKNYQLLLVEQNRLDEASEIESTLELIDDPSPYRWQRLAYLALETGQYRDAVKYYRRAIKNAPYMHELHYQLARAYSHLGNSEQSKNQMELAINSTHNTKFRSIYEQKLLAYSRKLDSLTEN